MFLNQSFSNYFNTFCHTRIFDSFTNIHSPKSAFKIKPTTVILTNWIVIGLIFSVYLNGFLMFYLYLTMQARKQLTNRRKAVFSIMTTAKFKVVFQKTASTGFLIRFDNLTCTKKVWQKLTNNNKIMETLAGILNCDLFLSCIYFECYIVMGLYTFLIMWEKK